MTESKKTFTLEQKQELADIIYRQAAAFNRAIKDGQEAEMEIHLAPSRDPETKKLIVDVCCHDIKIHTFKDPTKPEEKANEHGSPKTE